MLAGRGAVLQKCRSTLQQLAASVDTPPMAN
jgi:hypothetical protein